MSRLIFPAIVRDHEYIYTLRFAVDLTILIHITVLRSLLLFTIIYTYTFYTLMVWSYQLSFIIILYAHYKSTTATHSVGIYLYNYILHSKVFKFFPLHTDSRKNLFRLKYLVKLKYFSSC